MELKGTFAGLVLSALVTLPASAQAPSAPPADVDVPVIGAILDHREDLELSADQVTALERLAPLLRSSSPRPFRFAIASLLLSPRGRAVHLQAFAPNSARKCQSPQSQIEGFCNFVYYTVVPMRNQWASGDRCDCHPGSPVTTGWLMGQDR